MNGNLEHNPNEVEVNMIRYFDHDMTPAEMAEFMEWLNADEAHRQLFKEMRDLHIGLKSTYYNNEQQWKQFSSKVENRRRRHLAMQVLRYAAVVVVAVGATIGVLQMLHRPMAPTTYTCDANGLPTTLTLADGTFVKLGANSSLQFGSNFNDDNREVRLQGEGFFVVAKNEKKPFRVVSGDNEITVTGTKFDINTRNEDVFVATLIEGSVRFFNRQSRKSITLTPGRKLEYDNNRQTLTLSLSHATVDDYLADEHAFYSEPLSSILGRMGNVYGVEFVCESQDALNRRYRSIFNDGESLESFLAVIQSLTGLKHERINKNTIKLYQ